MGSVWVYFGLNDIHGLGLRWKLRHHASKKKRKIHSGLFAPLLILKEQHKYSSRASRQKLCKSIRQPTLSLSTVCDRMWQKAGGKMLNYEDTAANKSTSLLLFSSCSGCCNKSGIYLFRIRLCSNETEHIKHGWLSASISSCLLLSHSHRFQLFLAFPDSLIISRSDPNQFDWFGAARGRKPRE